MENNPNTPTTQVTTTSTPLTEQKNERKWLVPTIVVILLVLSTFVAVALIQRQTRLSSDAWSTTQTASAECSTNGTTINVSFTNTETNNSKCMNVIARDLQSNQTYDLGQIDPGETKTGEINLSDNTISAGQVKFDISWCNGSSGTDSRLASYTAITCNNQETISCGEVKIYNGQNQVIGNEDMKIGETIKLAITGTTTNSQGITKARFSMDGGTTWDETTQKNSNNEFVLEYLVPDEDEIAILAQVFNPNLGWN